jgi:hypothetical protein
MQSTATTTRRLPAVALAALFTLAMLTGVNTLARVEAAAPQLAQSAQTAAHTPA